MQKGAGIEKEKVGEVKNINGKKTRFYSTPLRPFPILFLLNHVTNPCFFYFKLKLNHFFKKRFGFKIAEQNGENENAAIINNKINHQSYNYQMHHVHSNNNHNNTINKQQIHHRILQLPQQ